MGCEVDILINRSLALVDFRLEREGKEGERRRVALSRAVAFFARRPRAGWMDDPIVTAAASAASSSPVVHCVSSLARRHRSELGYLYPISSPTCIDRNSAQTIYQESPAKLKTCSQPHSSAHRATSTPGVTALTMSRNHNHNNPPQDPFEDFLSSPPIGGAARAGRTANGDQGEIFESLSGRETGDRHLDPFFDEQVDVCDPSAQPGIIYVRQS